jgi:hypothetical protein
LTVFWSFDRLGAKGLKARILFLPALLLSLALVAGCTSVGNQATDEPDLVSSGTSEGHGYPYGTTEQGDYTPLTKAATSSDYGFTQENPVCVGGGLGEGSRNSKLYLRALRGPNGEPITFERRGSCCPFETESSDFGAGVLDVYDLTYPGMSEPLVLYVNMYDPAELLIPVGLTARHE